MKNFSLTSFKKYIFSYILAFIITLVFLAIVSIVFSFVPPHTRLLELLYNYSFILSAFIAAYFCAKASSGRGLLTGIISADIYLILLIAAGGLAFKSSLSLQDMLSVLFPGSVSGAVGGILGINSK